MTTSRRDGRLSIRRRWYRRTSIVAMGVSLLAGALGAQTLEPLPPRLPASYGGIPINGGRVHAIAVNPRNRDHIIISNEFGGLWKTENGGATWFHLDALSTVWSADVTYAPDGTTIVATLGRDMETPSRSGIWVSRNGGYTWSRPRTAAPPSTQRTPARQSAHGISYAPDDPYLVYVGTDYGVAVSRDNGETWSHHVVEASSPTDHDLLQSSANTVVALPRGRAITLTRRGVYRSDDMGRSWQRIRSGNFSGGHTATDFKGFDQADRSPADLNQVFILGLPHLLLYEVEERRWTVLGIPAWDGSRYPFVRIARSPTLVGIDLWVGLGRNLFHARCPDPTCVRKLTAESWTQLWRTEGIHDDSGDMGLDGRGYVVLYGSDGGVFRPVNEELTRWTNAATERSGLNSYQITDLAGTTRDPEGTPTWLYFATQDNRIWASPDAGRTWPFGDGCTEGYLIEAPVRAPRLEDVTIAYGCPDAVMMNDGRLQHPRRVSDQDLSGQALPKSGEAFFIAPEQWIRSRRPPGGSTEIWVSEDNGLHWRRRATSELEMRGGFTVSTTSPADGSPPRTSVYAPIRARRVTATGTERIGLARIRDPLARGVEAFDDGDLIYLSDGGSLGISSKMWEWYAVFGVHPTDPEFIIAPDIVNQVVKVSVDGGGTWTTDRNLTREVTANGTLLLYDGHGLLMQVTHINFDPYNSERILVGTRDAGVVISEDRGRTWRTIPGSRVIRFVTGSVFLPDSKVIVSSYGMGLWEANLRTVPIDFRPELYCPAPCGIRWLPGPLPGGDDGWERKDVFFMLRGRITGVDMIDGRLSTIRVSPGSRWIRHTPPGVDPVKFSIREDGSRTTIRGLARAFHLPRGARVHGVVLDRGALRGLLSIRGRLRPGDLLAQAFSSAAEDVAAPYLSLTTAVPGSGVPVLGRDGVVTLRGTGFEPDATEAQFRVEIDGVAVPAQLRQWNTDGAVHLSVRVSQALDLGQHTLRLIQIGGGTYREAVASFVKTVPELEDGRGRPPR